MELELALEELQWGVLGLAEIRRGFEAAQELKSGNILFHTAGINGQFGSGFLIHKKLKKDVMEFRGISERIATLVIEFHSKTYIIVQVHAPTTAHSDQEVDEFYEQVKETIDTMKEKYKGKSEIWIIGDFNAAVGTRRKEESKIMGPYGIGKRNKRGETLVNFASEQNMKLLNTYIEGTKDLKWTWRSPKDTFHENDYLMSHEIDNVLKAEIIHNLPFQSDHRMVQAYVSTKKQRKHIQKKTSTLKIINSPRSFQKYLNQKLNEEFQVKEDLDIQELYDKIISTIKWAVEQENKEHRSTDKIKSKKITEKTKELIMKREELNRKINKTATEKIEHTEIRKLVKREIKNDIRNYEENIIKEILETTKSTKTIKKELNQTSKCWIQKIEKEDKTVEYNREMIVEEATKFYETLYHDPEKTVDMSEDTVYAEEFDADNLCILEEEIAIIIKDLKKNKAPGIDNITNELIIAGKEELEDLIAYLFTEVLRQRKIPEQWEVGKIILLHKKDRRDQLSNYRPITLSCVMYKMFMKVIQKRISKKLQENQPCEQAGFRPTFSTTDHIHGLNQIIEKGHEYNIPLYIAFCDYSKAFDSLKHSYIWEALMRFGVEDIYVQILKEVYRKTRAYISLDKDGRLFKIERGVRQGCPASPDIFNAVLETIFRDVNWDNYGLLVNGKRINHLRFADDVVLISENYQELEIMINELSQQSLKRGLEMNKNKTKLLTNSQKKDIMLGQKKLIYENSYVYLGQTISTKKHLDEEIHRRITLGWSKYWSLKKITKGNIPPRIKGQVMEICIFPTLIYGCQTWAMNKTHHQKLARTQNKIMRSMLNIKLEQKIRTTTIEKQLQVKRVEHLAAILKFKWAGHMMRTQDNRWSKIITEWIPRDRKRSRGRQRKRWRDAIVECAGPLWMRQAQNREEWLKLSQNVFNTQLFN